MARSPHNSATVIYMGDAPEVFGKFRNQLTTLLDPTYYLPTSRLSIGLSIHYGTPISDRLIGRDIGYGLLQQRAVSTIITNPSTNLEPALIIMAYPAKSPHWGYEPDLQQTTINYAFGSAPCNASRGNHPNNLENCLLLPPVYLHQMY